MAIDSVGSSDTLNYVNTGSTTQSAGLSTDTKTFLKLLVAQMQYQNPLEPESDTEFVSQLAQMTSLQQVQGITSSVQSAQAFGMIGKHIEAAIINSKTGMTDCYSGVVDSVVIQKGVPYVVVGSDAIPASTVTRVYEDSNTGSSTGSTPATN